MQDSQAGASAIPEWEQTGPPDIEPHEITLGEKLGEGQFGTVYRGKCRGKEVAVKRLFKQDLDAETLADFKKEVEIMARLRHPNTLLFMGACTTPGNMAVVTEILSGGNVEELLKRKDVTLSLFTRMRMLKELAQGMNWLHESKPQIIHRDLKPANLLVDGNLSVKVCDFGLSAVKENKTAKLQDKDAIPGTPLFLAPEVLMGQPFDASSDVYSFAITAWEIYHRTEAFSEFTNFGTFKRAVCTRDVRPPLDPDTPKRFKELLEDCWHKDHAHRPPFKEIIERLDEIMIDVAIKDSMGNAFWIKHLKGRVTLSWERFSTEVAKYLNWGGLNTLDKEKLDMMRYLRFMVGETLSDMQVPPREVSMEGFGQTMNWFGPMDARGEFMVNIRQAMMQDWFHGPMSSKEAEKALANRKKGTFLVRLSSTGEGIFSVSRVGSTGISHQRMTYKPGVGFTLKYTQGKHSKKIQVNCTLPVYVTKHLAKELKLSIACAGSPYGFLYGAGAKHEKGCDVDGYAIVDEDSD